ncbi:hypothetical protein PC9H_011231, partial [Pleurotus ostreatus]
AFSLSEWYNFINLFATIARHRARRACSDGSGSLGSITASMNGASAAQISTNECSRIAYLPPMRFPRSLRGKYVEKWGYWVAKGPVQYVVAGAEHKRVERRCICNAQQLAAIARCRLARSHPTPPNSFLTSTRVEHPPYRCSPGHTVLAGRVLAAPPPSCTRDQSRLETYPVSAVRTDVSVGEGDADERTDVDAEAEDEADAYVDSDAEADPEVELLEAVDASKSNSTHSSSSGWPQGGGLTMEWRVLFQIPNPHIIILVILSYSSSYLTLSCISHGIVPSPVTFAIPVLLQNAPWPSLACFDALFR